MKSALSPPGATMPASVRVIIWPVGISPGFELDVNCRSAVVVSFDVTVPSESSFDVCWVVRLERFWSRGVLDELLTRFGIMAEA